MLEDYNKLCRILFFFYVFNARVAAVVLVRRDVVVEGWGDLWAGEFGVRARTRFGLGVLKSNERKNDGVRDPL